MVEPRTYSPAPGLFTRLVKSMAVLALAAAPALAAAKPIEPPHSCARDQHTIGFHGHFSSLERAVTAATDRFNPHSIREDREYMGAILKRTTPAQVEPTFTYTAAAGHARQDKITVKMTVPKDYEIVAFWHTHGAEHWSRKYFSDTDTSLAKRWGMPFYLADSSGMLRVYKPGAPTLTSLHATRLGLGTRPGYAKGQLVTHPGTDDIVRVSTRIVHKADSIIAGAAAPAQCDAPRTASIPA